MDKNNVILLTLMGNNNKNEPDPKTVSNATRVDETNDIEEDEEIELAANHSPDPKTTSNATRVDEENDLKSRKKMPPSSDQPKDLERKARKQNQERQKQNSENE